MTFPINILVPTGALGSGVDEDQVFAALVAGGIHAIACDAGSTDSGPSYLATGRCKYSRAAVKRNLDILMRAQSQFAIPLLIGSCGTSGSDEALNWTRDIALEIAAEHDLSPRIALLYSEQAQAVIAQKIQKGLIAPLAPMKAVDAEVFSGCARIVALMGPEPYIEALKQGVDIVLGGRSTDAGVLAAVPLMFGADPGAAWHAGKTAECGGLCTVNQRDGGVIIRVDSEGFEVEPLSPDNRCTPHTVSAHMLYENADAIHLTEPGGVVDVSKAEYIALDARRVRVRGSRFLPRPYTMKLEGAAANGFQTLMLVGIQDPEVLKSLPHFLAQMHSVMVSRVTATLKVDKSDFDISLRPYGWNAVSGIAPTDGFSPREIGLMLVATAASQEIATQVAKVCNPVLFHMPLDLDAPLPSYAFAFSPAEIERGAVYEFKLNHVVHTNQPLELVRTVLIENGATV